MSDALIATLQKQIDALTQETATLKSEAKSRRIAGKGLQAELDKLKSEHSTLATERDALKTAAEAKPGEHQAKIADLEGQIRTRDHRDAFGSVKEFEVTGQDGKAHKFTLADGVKLDALWQLTQYKAEGETPDAKAVSERYGAALQAHPFLFAEAKPDAGTTAARAATQPIHLARREGGPGLGKSDSNTQQAATDNRIVGQI